MRPFVRSLSLVPALVVLVSTHLQAQVRPASSDTVSIHLMDVDVRTAIQALSQYLDRPVVFGAVGNSKVTLQTPHSVRVAEVLPLLRATLESQNLELVADSGGPYRVRQKEQQRAVPLDAGLARARSGGDPRLYVIHLSHARAADVAATVNALYGRASAFGEIGNRPNTLSQNLAEDRQSSYEAITGPPQVPVPGAILGRSATLTGETTIVPDASTNSLLIRANPSDYELITAAVKELDMRPLQALIEVLVVEVRHDRALEFGVDISLPGAHLPGHPHTTYDGRQVGLGAGDASLHVVGIGGDPDLEASIRAAAARGDVSIVSRPTVIAANNEEAQILVGSQRPFVQVSRSLPTDGAARDQVVQYKDVGTKLSVRPTISGDGYVTLQVSQEVSAATTETQFDAPIISTRAVQTRLLLRDGQTVVIGGLTDRQREVTQAGIPILSSIPVLGALFGHAARRTSETELFLFITPRVIRNDEDADHLTQPLQKRSGVAKP
ncbi:MAG: type II secretion system protein GspD [Gemmatimonadaceae bacterium]